ncbi:MAG TPA: tail fiber domain-containing protein [Leptospiraceae bacterium]|nr:tail fiber domain-containing protein [Leptospiraceae bacterium]
MKNKPAQPESSLKENLEVAGFETCPDGSSNPTMTSSSHRRFLDLSAFKRGISHGLGIIFTLGASALLAVAVTGTVNTFVNGSVMEASQLNTNFSSLKTAIEGITSSQWTSNGSSIYYNGGNVGIGTVSPTSTLDVQNKLVFPLPGTSGRPILKLASTASVGGGFQFNSNSTDYFYQYYDNNGIVFNAGTWTESPSSAIMIIKPSGNVGIGTTTPGARFTLNQAAETNTEGIRIVDGSVTWNIFSNAGGRLNFTSTGGANINFRDDGVVLIGTSTLDGANLFTVNSANVSKTGGGSWNSISDIRLKHSVQEYSGGLNLIEKIHPILFHYKDDKSISMKDEGQHIGISAQEIQKIIPEAVMQGRGGYLQFKQDYVFWTMLNAVKELKSLHDKETSSLSERLDTEKKKNDKLAEELASIKTQDRVSQRETQQIIEENSKLRERITKLETENKKLFTLEERLRALETFQTAAAAAAANANANAGKERKQ